jgi:hypothetical protein
MRQVADIVFHPRDRHGDLRHEYTEPPDGWDADETAWLRRKYRCTREQAARLQWEAAQVRAYRDELNRALCLKDAGGKYLPPEAIEALYADLDRKAEARRQELIRGREEKGRGV